MIKTTEKQWGRAILGLTGPHRQDTWVLSLICLVLVSGHAVGAYPVGPPPAASPGLSSQAQTAALKQEELALAESLEQAIQLAPNNMRYRQAYEKAKQRR